MSANKLLNSNQYHSAGELQPVSLYLKFTGAADVDANGYAINRNKGGFVSTVAKTAEGVITITLRDKWAALLDLNVIHGKDDTTITWDSEDVDGVRTIVLTCRTGAADVDPDSTAFLVSMVLSNHDE